MKPKTHQFAFQLQVNNEASYPFRTFQAAKEFAPSVSGRAVLYHSRWRAYLDSERRSRNRILSGRKKPCLNECRNAVDFARTACFETKHEAYTARPHKGGKEGPRRLLFEQV